MLSIANKCLQKVATETENENEKWLKIEEAVNATKNQYITYDDEVIAAFFHANSGGKTEDVKYIWGECEIPYLKSVVGYEKDLDEISEEIKKGLEIVLVDKLDQVLNIAFVK